MKKLLVVLLTLALCVSMLSSCDFLGNLFGGSKEETPAVEYNVDAAAEYVYNLYKDKSITSADFEVTAVAAIAGVKHTVEWSVDTDKVTITKKDDNTYIINVDEESSAEVKYVLTATVKGGDKTATKSFNLTVPKYELTSHEDYMAAKEGDNVVVKGVVVAINSKAAGNKYNHLFLADLEGKGGYYCYAMAKDPIADDGIELGMVVEVSGPLTPYSGMQEIKGGTARIVDSNKQTVAPVDVTAKFSAGESLANYVGMPVTIKGVEIKGQALEKDTDQYLNFELNGKTAYLRTYVSDFPTTLGVVNTDGVYTSDKKAVIDEAHAAHFGWEANVTGILVLYNSNPYLIPMNVDCFEYIKKIEKTPEQKIADVLEQITIGTLYNVNTEVKLPESVDSSVSLSWASSNTEVITIVEAEGKMNVVIPETATEVVITVTATCDGKTGTKEFKVTLTKMVDPNTFLSLPQANEIGVLQGHNTYTEGKYFVTGTIKSIVNTTYGNFYIQDEEGNEFYVYGLYTLGGTIRFDSMDPQPQVGDTVIIYGAVGQYNGSAQMKNAWLVADPAADSELSVLAVIALGASKTHNTYTTDKYSVTGVITEVYNTTYGNMKITDAAGNILTIYGTYSATGENRYDAMEVKPVAGDTVTIYGIVGQYNGTAQIKNGWITAHTPAASENPDNPDTPTGNIVDMASFSKGDGKDTSYAERTNSQGWTAVNAAAITGKEYNGATTWAITLNGKVGAAGQLTSATLTGGLKSVSFKYGFPFSDTQVKLTINVKQGDTVVATTVLERTDLAQNTVYDFAWNLDTAVEGEFTIEIINECISASSKNKDRLSIWDLTWENN